MLSLQIGRWGQAKIEPVMTDMLIPANTWPRVDSLDKTGGPARESRKVNAAQRRSLQQLYLLEPTARVPLQLYVHGLPFPGTLLHLFVVKTLSLQLSSS